MKVAIWPGPEPPWTMVDCLITDPNGSGDLKFLDSCSGRYGAAIDLALLAGKFLNLPVDLVWSNRNPVGQVRNHSVDTCVPQISPTYGRSLLVSFTNYMLMEHSACFGQCSHVQITGGFQMSNVLTSQPLVFLGLILILNILMCLVLMVSYMLNQKRTVRDSLRMSLAQTVSGFTGFQVKPYSKTSVQEKINIASVSLFFVIYVNGVVSSKLLSSFLQQVKLPFTDHEDLAEKIRAGQFRILVQSKAAPFWAVLKQNPFLGPVTVSHADAFLFEDEGHPVEEVFRNSDILWLHYTATMKWQLAKMRKEQPHLGDIKCIFDMACVFKDVPDGFITAKDRPDLWTRLNMATSALRESGVVQKIEKDYHMEQEGQGNRKLDVARGSVPDFTTTALKVYASGIGVSCAWLLLEGALASEIRSVLQRIVQIQQKPLGVTIFSEKAEYIIG